MIETPPPPRRSRRTTLAVLACAVAVVGAAGAAYVLTRSGPRHQVVAEAPAAPPESIPAVATPPPPAVSTVPHKSPARHDYVPAAVPTAFKLTGPKFTIKAHVCAMPPVFPLDPPGEQHHTVCWVTRGFGVAPGSRSRTSYLLGHSWAPDPQEVLNKASSRATREILHGNTGTMNGIPVHPVKSLDGYKLILRTRTGTLTYVVHGSFGVRKNQLGLVKQTIDQRIGRRIVLITCAELNGVDYDYNVVINAYLAASARSSVG